MYLDGELEKMERSCSGSSSVDIVINHQPKTIKIGTFNTY